MTQADAGSPAPRSPAPRGSTRRGPTGAVTAPGRRARIALAAALTWSLLLLVASVVAPAYSTQTVTSEGTSTRSTVTLVQENGWGVLGVIALPLVAVLLVTVLLLPASTRQLGVRRARALAWVVVAGLGMLGLLSLMTIGLFLLPVAVTLALVVGTLTPPSAARSSPDGSRSAPRSPRES